MRPSRRIGVEPLSCRCDAGAAGNTDFSRLTCTLYGGTTRIFCGPMS
jgi:hypothetical protein